MLFLPFLLLLPLLVDGTKRVDKCDKDACLQYSARCGAWSTKTKNEKMDDCNVSEGPTVELYLHIDVVSSTQWQLFIDFDSKNNVSIKSPRIHLRRNNKVKQWEWNIEVDGETRKTILGKRIEINETTPLLELFADAQISATINNTDVIYDSPLIWKLVAERGPMSCSKKDIKTAFLIILIAYAVFSTIVAVLLSLMIYCIGRQAKYQRVPTTKPPSSKNESVNEPELPQLDRTTAGTKEIPTESNLTAATDISRLKTDDSKISKKN